MQRRLKKQNNNVAKKKLKKWLVKFISFFAVFGIFSSVAAFSGMLTPMQVLILCLSCSSMSVFFEAIDLKIDKILERRKNKKFEELGLLNDDIDKKEKPELNKFENSKKPEVIIEEVKKMPNVFNDYTEVELGCKIKKIGQKK